MFKDPFHWFPDPYFSTILASLVLGAFFIDSALPKKLNPHQINKHDTSLDRTSFLIIRILGSLAITITLICRYLNLLITPAYIQYLGLLLIPAGLALREWAIIKLGRFFSRTVQLETGHKIITDGPYRWIRHPSYTGMILIYLGIAFALGTWLGVLVTLGLMLGATVHRISIEEEVLIEAFGTAYRNYMKRTWRLFPGW
jgi:protein-S-isoprenylcysteine O-methyltransferase Ste14